MVVDIIKIIRRFCYFANLINFSQQRHNKKLSYCWEIVRHESMPRIAEMDVEMTT